MKPSPFSPKMTPAVKVTYHNPKTGKTYNRLMTFGGVFGSRTSAIATCIQKIEDGIPVGELPESYTVEVEETEINLNDYWMTGSRE